MGPHEWPPGVLRELTDVIAMPFSITLPGHGDWEKFLKTGREQMSVLSPRKARRKIQGTTGWSPSP